MSAASFSFLDVAVLDEVRGRFATGEALVVLSTDLEEVIWANGAGAALLGYPHVLAAIGAPSRLGIATRRQIASTAGFPEIGRDREIAARMTAGLGSQVVRLLASRITLPDGGAAILFAAPAAGGERGAGEVARRAIGGFGGPGHFVALVTGDGAVEASSAGFETLGIGAASLGALASGLPEGGIAKRLVAGARGELPAGMARLTDRSFLVVAIDEAAALAAAAQAAGGTVLPGESTEPGPQAGDPATASPAGAGMAAARRGVDLEPPPGPMPQREDAAAAEAEAEAGRAPNAAPVRFVWRTDAQGRFSQISPELAAVVGKAAADVVGRRFADVADDLGIDPAGDIAGLLARRDTWSGRSVLWPIADTPRRIPVDLAALPVYDRNRNFEGFRGFGVAHPGDAAADAEAPAGAIEAGAAGDTAAPMPATEARPLPQQPEPEPKAASLAGHRQPAAEKGLTSGERIAFQQIAERLKRESGLATEEPPAGPAAEAATPEAPAPGTRPDKRAGPPEARLRPSGQPPASFGRFAAAPAAPPPPGKMEGSPAAAPAADPRPGGRAEPPEARLRPPDQAPAGYGSFDAPPSRPPVPEVEPRPARAGRPEGAEAPAAGAGGTPGPGRSEEEESPPATPERPGLSLLDFAEWDGRTQPKPPRQDGDEPAGEHAAGGSAPERQHGPGERLARSGSEHAALPQAPGGRSESRWPASAGPLRQPHAVEPRGIADAAQPASQMPPAAASSGAVPRPGVETRGATGMPVADEPGRNGAPILEKLPVPVLVHSGDALHYANPEFLALSGYASVAELAAAGGIGALFAKPYGGEEVPGDRRLRLRNRNGEEFPVKAVLRSVPWDGGKALLLVLARSREAAAPGSRPPPVAELEARLAELTTIIDTATDGVVLISPDGTIRSISRPAEALFGFDSDEVAGKPFAALFAVDSQRAARDYLHGLSDHGVASVLNDGREVIGRESKGRFVPLFMTIGKLPADSGYCAVVRDITQWKRAEEDLTQARSRAERASAHKTEFLARISHEIRTPLNAIIGFSELMIDEKFGPVANDRYRDYLRDINRSGNHVLDLVNDLLDISKIEAGQQEMAYEAVSLNDTLAETVALMQPQANRERVIIRSSFASKLPEVVADLRSVRQIALNVLSNAIRYTPAGGQVIVSTAYEATGEVVMRVRDTGVGMTQAEIEQALKPFKQVAALRRARGDGTGLGLPLTKAMVEANRARFSISSAPADGTLVEISFPSMRVLAG